MSTNLADARLRAPLGGALRAPLRPPAHSEEPSRPSRLEIVPTRAQRRARPRTIFAFFSIAIVVGIVTTQLLLSVAVAQGAFQLNSLQTSTKALQRDAQVASEDLDRVESPQYLAENANKLGMVTNSTPAYLRLSDGAVLGDPQAASAAAGTVTGSSGNLVANSLLGGVPLVNPNADSSTKAPTPQKPSASPTTAGNSGNSASTSASTAGSAGSTVALNGALPTPETH
jgi:hypothetical protein